MEELFSLLGSTSTAAVCATGSSSDGPLAVPARLPHCAIQVSIAPSFILWYLVGEAINLCFIWPFKSTSGTSACWPRVRRDGHAGDAVS